jgi:hypothetical protein
MAKHSYSSQEKKSMLLSLPAHLRNTILKLMLGDRTIHINARPQSLFVRTCSATENDGQAIQKFNNLKYQQLPHHYQVRHARCWSRNNDCCRLQASLAILLVCRQLYTEAALLPFSTNDFAFDGSNSHRHGEFLDRLRPLQRRAIRRVHFGPQIFYLQSPFGPVQKLSGLQEIVLFLKEDVCELTSSDDLSGERKKWLIERLCDTQCKTLRAIHVCISSDKGAGHSSKLRIVCWAQALGNQMCCARAELELGRQRLVLRCRPATGSYDTDCLAALDGEFEASD